MFKSRLAQIAEVLGTVGTIAIVGWGILPAMAQNRDTTPLCYFIDASGNHQDLTPWCGKPQTAPNAAVPSSPSMAPSTLDRSSPSTNRSDKVVLTSCRVDRDTPGNRANAQRPIVHLTGSVTNLTGQPAQNVTVRYVIRSRGSVLDRRGQMINEPVLAPNATGLFDRRDQPIAIESVEGADNNWRAEVEAIEWIANGQQMTHTLPEPQRCTNS